MPGPTAPDAFDDVNEAVSTAWEAETTPDERVREIISHTYTPTAAATIAKTARMSSKTARNHLTTLAEEGFVATETDKHGETTFRRSAESLVVEQATELRDDVSTDELVTRIAELRKRITDVQAEDGVESPAALLVDQPNDPLSTAAVPHDDLDAETIREWQTVRRNLAIATAALAIATAERVVSGEPLSSHGGTSDYSHSEPRHTATPSYPDG